MNLTNTHKHAHSIKVGACNEKGKVSLGLQQEAYNKLERVSSSVHVVEFGPPKKENKPDFYEAKNQS